MTGRHALRPAEAEAPAATSGGRDPALAPQAGNPGIAIWASLPDEAEARLQEQTRAGVFPLRLKPEDWTSGGNHWLPGVIAPDPRSAAAVIGNFRQLTKDGRMKLHPGILRLLVAETLKNWTAAQGGGEANAAVDTAQSQTGETRRGLS